MPSIIGKSPNNYESRIKEVFALKEKSLFLEGINLLKIMDKEFKNDKVIFGLLGTFHYEIKDYKNSSKYFRKTLNINPNSELISLSLFHSYFELGKINLALKEINRFCKENTPKLYKITIKELNDNLHNFNKIEKGMILKLPFR